MSTSCPCLTLSHNRNKHCRNFLHLIYANVIELPNETCLNWIELHNISNITIETQLTYSEIWNCMINIANILKQNNIPIGSNIILCFSLNGFEFICTFLACLFYGCIPIPIYPPTPHNKIAALNKMNAIINLVKPIAILANNDIIQYKAISSIQLNIKQLGNNNKINWPNANYIQIPQLIQLKKANNKLNGIPTFQDLID
jgi:acyl-CoA synthetase (AMP-forming)/AMP-acid ligase II